MFEGVGVAGGAGRTSSGEYMRTTKQAKAGHNTSERSRAAHARTKRTRAQHQRRVLAPAASAPHMRGAVLLVGGPRRPPQRARTKTPKSGLQCAHAHLCWAQRDAPAPGPTRTSRPRAPRTRALAASPRGVRGRAAQGGAGVGNMREGLRFEYFFYSLFRRASSAASTYP